MNRRQLLQWSASLATGATLALALASGAAMAQSKPIKIGVTIAKTGPAASLGIPQANTVPLLPTEVAGQKVEWIVLDDASDTTKGVANTRTILPVKQIKATSALKVEASCAISWRIAWYFESRVSWSASRSCC